MKIICAHQPQYLPYLGIFNKISKSNIFLFLSGVAYQKKAWINRTLVKLNNFKSAYLTIPVKDIHLNTIIKDVQINDHNWKFKHLKTLELNYKKKKGFDSFFPVLHRVLSIKSNFLIDYTIPAMVEIINIFKIKTIIKTDDELFFKEKGTDLLIEITKKLKGDTYLSGIGSKNYVNESIFKKNNIMHLINNFSHPIYKQKGSFLPNMSIIDLIFNEGIEEANNIFWNNES
jgi:hypothetical protein